MISPYAGRRNADGGRHSVFGPQENSAAADRIPSLTRSVPADAADVAGSPRKGLYRRIWPREDGRSWTYRITERSWDFPEPTFYSSPDQVPVLTLDDAAALLGHHPIGENPVTSAGTFHHAVTVLYLIDFGVSVATDVDGNPLGYFSSYLYGTVSYAPGVGPVQSYERLALFVGDPLGPGIGDATLILLATDPGPRGVLAARD